MREIRLSGSEGGAGSIPVPTPILGRRWQERAESSVGALTLAAPASRVVRVATRG